jgi:hypothetical protein
MKFHFRWQHSISKVIALDLNGGMEKNWFFLPTKTVDPSRIRSLAGCIYSGKIRPPGTTLNFAKFLNGRK